MAVFDRYYQLKSTQFDSYRSVQARQLQKLQHLTVHAVSHIPHYKLLGISRDKIDSAEDVESILRLFPVLSKNKVRESLEEMHIDHDGTQYVNFTGGTTGRIGKFYQDKKFLLASLATTLLMYEWAGRRPGDKLVKLWGAERDFVDGTIGWKHLLMDWLANRITLNSFVMDTQRMTAYIDRINKEKPILIEGYADSLYDFSRYIRKSGKSIYQPNSIVSSAGTLHLHMREEIETVFGCEIFDRYGSREAGNMAAECSAHRGLHIFSETTVIEIIGPEGQHCKQGEEGRILVTNLTNFTMPLIRYDIGDQAVAGSSSCACGRSYPLLDRIIGRSCGSIRLEGGGVVNPTFFIHTVGVMCNKGAIKRFQIVQKSHNHLLIKLIFYEDFSLSTWSHKNDAARLIQKAMGDNCRLDFEEVSHISLTATGKHLYTICEMND